MQEEGVATQPNIAAGFAGGKEVCAAGGTNIVELGELVAACAQALIKKIASPHFLRYCFTNHSYGSNTLGFVATQLLP